MRKLTDRPFGVNIAQAFVRDPDIVQFVIDQGVQFVTTSAGSPTRYTRQIKDAGLENDAFDTASVLMGGVLLAAVGVGAYLYTYGFD